MLHFADGQHPVPGQTLTTGSPLQVELNLSLAAGMLAKAEQTHNPAAPTPPGHSSQHRLDVIPLHRPSTPLQRHRRTPHYHRHLQIHCSPNPSSTSRPEADPSPHSAVNTLALLDLLLAQMPPAAPTSDSSVSLQSETAELCQSPTEAAVVAPEFDTSLSLPKPARSAGASGQTISGKSAQTTSGTSAQTPAGTSAQTPEDIWAQAWQPLEAGQAAQAQQAKTNASAAHANVKSTSLPLLRFWRQQQLSDDDGHTDQQQQKLHHNSG